MSSSDADRSWTNDPFGGSGNRPPAFKLRRRRDGENDPAMVAAIESKLQSPSGQHGIRTDDVDELEHYMPTNQLAGQALQSAHKIRDARLVMQNLPDIRLAGDIVTFAICNLGYSTRKVTIESSHAGVLPPDVNSSMLSPIIRYLDDEIGITTNIAKWVKRALITHGSTPFLVLPESTIDDVINTDLYGGNNQYREAISMATESWGMLGPGITHVPKYDAGLNNYESSGVAFAQNDLSYRVSDNLDFLKLPEVEEKNVRLNLDSAYASRFKRFNGRKHDPKLQAGNNGLDLSKALNTPQLDSAGRPKMQRDLLALAKQDRRYRRKHLQVLRDPSTLEKENVGHATMRVIPSESVIPIVKPGVPEEPVAYWVLHDQFGNPVSLDNAISHRGSVSVNDLPSSMISQVNAAMSLENRNNGQTNQNVVDYNTALSIYTNIVCHDLNARMQNGILGKSYTTTKPNDIFELMFSLSMQKKEVRVVFVPASLMVYMAFNVDDNGIGESLIDLSKHISSMRMVQMYSRSYHSWMSSINRRRLNITIDPRTPDPMGAGQKIFRGFLENNNHMILPTKVIDPTSIMSSVYAQAFEVNFTSDTRVPNSKIEVEPIDYVKVEPDEQLAEDLAKMSAMHFSLTPEQIDTSLGDERATSRILNNEMFRERITGYQQVVNHSITRLVRALVLNSSYLMDEITDIATKAKDSITGNGIGHDEGKNLAFDIERFIFNWVDGLNAHLPNIEDEVPDETSENYGKYADFVDKLVDDVILNEEVIRANDENQTLEQLNMLRASVKVDLKQGWLAERATDLGLERYFGSSGEAGEFEAIAKGIVSRTSGAMKIASTLAKSLREIGDDAKEAVPLRGGQIAAENNEGAPDEPTDDGTGGDDGGIPGMEDLDMGMDEPAAEDETGADDAPAEE